MTNLYQQLNPQSQLSSNITNLIKQFKTMSNPQAMIQQMLQRNPQVNSLIQAANGNPEKAFRDLAKQMNVDADQIIQAMRNA